MLRLEHVTREYRGDGGRRRALDDVTLSLEPGTMTALVGENGAGKTTLLRIAATLDEPTSGRVTVDGLDPRNEGAAARRRIAHLGQDAGLYDALTVRENLAFVARFYGRKGEIEPAAAALGIAHRLDARARVLSRGDRQRAAIARALLAGDLLLLDEPTTALDRDGRALAMEAVRRSGRTALVATHDDAVARACDRVVRLHEGKVVDK